MINNDFTAEKRAALLKRFGPNQLLMDISEEAWIHAKLNTISSLNPIQSFDLEERSVEIVCSISYRENSI